MGLGFGVNLVPGHLAVYVGSTLLWTLAEVVGFPVTSARSRMLLPRIGPGSLPCGEVGELEASGD